MVEQFGLAMIPFFAQVATDAKLLPIFFAIPMVLFYVILMALGNIRAEVTEPGLLRATPAFVTLRRRNGELRGCIGRLDSDKPLYRVVQESLTNIHRHSGSQTATIALSSDSDQVTLRVTDEGRGMSEDKLRPAGGPIASLGVGIAGMRERVRQLRGRLEIQSNGKGTSLTVVLPLLSDRTTSANAEY